MTCCGLVIISRKRNVYNDNCDNAKNIEIKRKEQTCSVFSKVSRTTRSVFLLLSFGSIDWMRKVETNHMFTGLGSSFIYTR